MPENSLPPPAVSRRIHAAAVTAKPPVRSRLVLVPGAGHDFLDRRESLVRLVAGWLKQRLEN